MPTGRHRPTCTVAECGRPHEALGYCRKHYQQFGREGKLKDRGECAHPGCRKREYCRGYCSIHYGRLKNGKPMDVGKLDPFRYVTSFTVHERVKKMWGPARNYSCIECGGQARDWAYDGTDPTQLYGPAKWYSNLEKASYSFYSRFPEFYMPMCSPCHRRRDGAAAARELREYRSFKYETGYTLEDFLYYTQEAEIDRLSSQAEL